MYVLHVVVIPTDRPTDLSRLVVGDLQTVSHGNGGRVLRDTMFEERVQTRTHTDTRVHTNTHTRTHTGTDVQTQTARPYTVVTHMLFAMCINRDQTLFPRASLDFPLYFSFYFQEKNAVRI